MRHGRCLVLLQRPHMHSIPLELLVGLYGQLNPAPSNKLITSFFVAHLRWRKKLSFLCPMVRRRTTSSEFSRLNRSSALLNTSTKAFTAAAPDPSWRRACRSSCRKRPGVGKGGGRVRNIYQGRPTQASPAPTDAPPGTPRRQALVVSAAGMS